MNMRPVNYALGLMIMGLGLSMLLPAALDFADGAPDWRNFALPGGLATILGAVLGLINHQSNARIMVHEAFILTVLVWAVLALIAAAPFLLDGMSLADAVFESMSGLTTTGATVMTALDDQPRGILLWRALLQWFGGIGIIVTAIAVLPMLRVGGMQLFQLESSDASGKFLPRVHEIAGQTAIIYLGLTIVCAFMYAATGMSNFNSLAHAMTTISAGGFSTSDQSFAAFAANGADLIAICFMMLAGLPFGLMVLAMRGNAKPILSDPQPRLFSMIALVSALAIGLALLSGSEYSAGQSMRLAAFNTVSILTGTGYATADFSQWGAFPTSLLLLLMFCGGCAGSAACGMKIFRLHICSLMLIARARTMARPKRIAPIRYGKRIIGNSTLQSIELFVVLYLGSFAVFACALALLGLDPQTAISAAAACLGNVGPGLGSEIGPAGNYASLPIAAKWICALAMLIGRLELIAAFVVLNPRYWRG